MMDSMISEGDYVVVNDNTDEYDRYYGTPTNRCLTAKCFCVTLSVVLLVLAILAVVAYLVIITNYL